MTKAFNVVLQNTAAWEFDDVARAHMEEEVARQCDSETEPVSLARVQASVRNTMNECIGNAKRLGVRVNSRGVHHKGRFGVNCVDYRPMTILEWSISRFG
jgi:hypothetical protein